MASTNNQAKKILIFLLSVFIILSAVFLYFKLIGKTPENLPLNTPDALAEQKRQDKETIEKIASFIKTNDIAQCDSVERVIDGTNYKTVCRNNIFSKRAVENLDFAACGNLDNVLRSISDCKKIVLGLLIEKEGVLSACEKVPPDMESFCPDVYWNFAARGKMDPRLCANISSAAGILNCQNNILSISITENKTVDCSLFTEDSVKTDCLAYKNAKGNCGSIQNPGLQHECEHK